MDGEASSPARCRASNLRFEPSAVSPRAKPENPKGFQPPYHPHQFLLKSKRFPGAKTARKRFFFWKMRFSGAKIVPCPPYTPLGAIESSRGLRPSRALRGGATVCAAETSGFRRILGLSMAPEIVNRTRGIKWLSSLPTAADRSRSPEYWSSRRFRPPSPRSAQPVRCARSPRPSRSVRPCPPARYRAGHARRTVRPAVR